MQITINQDKLSRALNYVSKAVSTKPNIPVLSNVMLDVTHNDLRLSATNLDMGITMWIAGNVVVEGKLTASGKTLADFVNANREGKLELKLEKDVLVVSSDSARADFLTIPASEFPILPKAAGEPFFTAAPKDLIHALEQTVFATSTDYATSKVQYTGVLFDLDSDSPDSLTMIGLDGFRLSHKRLNITAGAVQNGIRQMIVPARSLQELARILSAEECEEVGVYLSDSKSQLIFKFNEIEVSVRLLEGPYPDYKRVMPADHSYSFDVRKDEFDRAMKIVNTFARSQQGNRVDFDLDIESGKLVLRSKVSELGVNETSLEVQNAAGSADLKDAYSLQFLIEMSNHMSGEIIHFETNAPLAAAVFTDPTDESYVHLVMPLQRND